MVGGEFAVRSRKLTAHYKGRLLHPAAAAVEDGGEPAAAGGVADNGSPQRPAVGGAVPQKEL